MTLAERARAALRKQAEDALAKINDTRHHMLQALLAEGATIAENG
jgi:hypothetical protein